MLTAILAGLQGAIQYGPGAVALIVNIANEAKAVLSAPDLATLEAALAQKRADNVALFDQVDAELEAAANR